MRVDNLDRQRRRSRAILKFAAAEVVPRLAGTSDEIVQILRALNGALHRGRPIGFHRCAAWSNVLPTGRNFYSVDPKGGAIPAGMGKPVWRWPIHY